NGLSMADNLTAAQRRYCMSRVGTKGTDLEKLVGSELRRRGLRFRKNVKALPGKPDIVFTNAKVAVFIDGDFWHGYRFPVWEKTLTRFWRDKIRKNRKRDKRNFSELRKMGWRVIRLWQHNIKRDLSSCVNKIVSMERCGVKHRC
ncbi:MAG: very short patch repair endonuclease, partial [Verrucomicrobiota bacterium]